MKLADSKNFVPSNKETNVCISILIVCISIRIFSIYMHMYVYIIFVEKILFQWSFYDILRAMLLLGAEKQLKKAKISEIGRGVLEFEKE